MESIKIKILKSTQIDFTVILVLAMVCTPKRFHIYVSAGNLIDFYYLVSRSNSQKFCKFEFFISNFWRLGKGHFNFCLNSNSHSRY